MPKLQPFEIPDELTRLIAETVDLYAEVSRCIDESAKVQEAYRNLGWTDSPRLPRTEEPRPQLDPNGWSQLQKAVEVALKRAAGLAQAARDILDDAAIADRRLVPAQARCAASVASVLSMQLEGGGDLPAAKSFLVVLKDCLEEAAGLLQADQGGTAPNVSLEASGPPRGRHSEIHGNPETKLPPPPESGDQSRDSEKSVRVPPEFGIKLGAAMGSYGHNQAKACKGIGRKDDDDPIDPKTLRKLLSGKGCVHLATLTRAEAYIAAAPRPRTLHK